MSYSLLNIEDYNDDNINFDLPNNMNGNIVCNNISNNIYQTPKLVIKSKIYKKNNNSYIDIIISNNDIKSFIKKIDQTIINETKNKNKLWFKKELPENTIVSYYSSIIKKDKKQDYFTIQLNDKTKIYDENHNTLNIKDINELDNVILLINISNIIFNKDSYYCNIVCNHMKIYKEKLSLTDMIKTNNILDNNIINNLVNDNEVENEEDNEEDSDEESDEESEEEDNLDDYEISSRMIINKRKELNNVYKNAEDASINAHKLRKEAIELAQELEEYESMKTEMN